MFFTASDDSGASFEYTTPMDISNNNGGQNGQQRMAVVGNNVYVTWEDNTTARNETSILFRANSNYGAQNAWGPILNLTTTDINQNCSLLCGDPTIAANGTWVYISWVEQHNNGSADQGIFFDSSNNNGTSFRGAIDLGPFDASSSHEQEMAAWGNDIYLTWDDTHFGNAGLSETSYFTVSHNNGATFYGGKYSFQNLTSTETPNPKSTNERSREPHIAAYGGNVYVTWEDNRLTGNYEAILTTSTNGGNSFGPAQVLSAGVKAVTWLPIVFATGNYVYDSWWQNAKPNQVYLASSTDAGTSFSSAHNVSHDSGTAKNPLIAEDGSTVFLMWSDTSFGGTVKAVGAVSTDAGTTFSSPVVLDASLGHYIIQQNDSPQTAIVGNLIFACWLDTGATAPQGIYFSVGTIGD